MSCHHKFFPLEAWRDGNSSNLQERDRDTLYATLVPQQKAEFTAAGKKITRGLRMKPSFQCFLLLILKKMKASGNLDLAHCKGSHRI